MPVDNPLHDLALAAIDADAQAKELLIARDRSSLIPFSTIYAYVNNPSFIPPTDFENLLERDLSAQENLNRLLEKASLAYMPMLAAASSGEVTRRETDVAIMTLTPSRVEQGQVYLKIEVKDLNAEMPTQIFVRRAGGPWIRTALPNFVNAQTQLLLEAKSSIAQVLSVPDGEVYLC